MNCDVVLESWWWISDCCDGNGLDDLLLCLPMLLLLVHMLIYAYHVNVIQWCEYCVCACVSVIIVRIVIMIVLLILGWYYYIHIILHVYQKILFIGLLITTIFIVDVQNWLC